VAYGAGVRIRPRPELSILHISELGRVGVYDISTPGEAEKSLAEAKVITYAVHRNSAESADDRERDTVTA